MLDPSDCANFFFRANSGHSFDTIFHARSLAGGTDLRSRIDLPLGEGLLVHGTTYSALQGIEDKGMIPGGTVKGRGKGREARAEIHFLPEEMLLHNPTHLANQSEILIFIDRETAARYDAKVSLTGYVLIEKTIGYWDIFMIWSCSRQMWEKAPSVGDLYDIMDQYSQIPDGPGIHSTAHFLFSFHVGYQLREIESRTGRRERPLWEYSRYGSRRLRYPGVDNQDIYLLLAKTLNFALKEKIVPQPSKTRHLVDMSMVSMRTLPRLRYIQMLRISMACSSPIATSVSLFTRISTVQLM